MNWCLYSKQEQFFEKYEHNYIRNVLTRRKMLKASGETGNLNLLSRQPYSLYGFAALYISTFPHFVLLRLLKVSYKVQHYSFVPVDL